MPEQSRLDVLRLQWLTQKRIVEQIDLSHGEVVGRTPIRVDKTKLLVR
jgi:hypothetical protein